MRFVVTVLVKLVIVFGGLGYAGTLALWGAVSRGVVPGESFDEWVETMHFPFLFMPVRRDDAKRTTPAPVPVMVKDTTTGLVLPIASGTYEVPASTRTLYGATMGTVPAVVPVGKFSGFIEELAGYKLSFGKRATPLVIYVPAVEVTGPDVVSPAFL